MSCGCPVKQRPVMGHWGKFGAFPEDPPSPLTGLAGPAGKGYYGGYSSPQTLSRQGVPATPEAPFHSEQRNVAPIGGIHASSVEVARSGLALQISTVFRRAVQYIKPEWPVLAPLQSTSYLTMGIVNPPDRAVEGPRYSFAAIDSEALLEQAKDRASMNYRMGKR